MGRTREKDSSRSQTLPSSPSHSFSSSSSSEFEFTVSVSPRKSSSNICPADELFYKGQLLPLHLSPRISMVRTLLLTSSSTSSSSDTNTTASRDSTGSASSNDSNSSFSNDLGLLAECDSSRPSSVTEDDEFRRFNGNQNFRPIKKSKYFPLARFSSVFKKESGNREQDNVPDSSVKRMSATAKEVIRKYLKKVKPLYEKLRQQKMGGFATNPKCVSFPPKTERSVRDIEVSGKNTRKENLAGFSHSFSGNLSSPRRKNCVSSCPSSIRSSPSHSGILSRSGVSGMSGGCRVGGGGMYSTDTSSTEELQSSILGAIAYCKNSMTKSLVSN